MRVTLLAQAAEPSCYSRLTNEWICWQYVEDRQDEIVDATIEHLVITVVAVAARPGDRVPAGAARAPPPAGWRPAILAVTTGIYTIPSLALFPLLVPFTGLSPTTVVIGLALYALTILVRSMLEGLRAVPDEVVESATGLGYGADPAAVPDRAAAGAAGDHGRAAGRHRLDRRADHRRRARGVRRPRQPDHGRRDRRTSAPSCSPPRCCAWCWPSLLDVLLVGCPAADDARGRGGSRDMNVFADTWDYLTTASNWTGDGGMLELLVEQLLLTVTALAHGDARRAPDRAWLGHLGRGGFLAINISNVGRAIPTFALLALLVTADWPGTDGVRPLRPRRAGDPDRADPVRAAADHHQRLRRRPRGARPTSRSRPRGWA